MRFPSSCRCRSLPAIGSVPKQISGTLGASLLLADMFRQQTEEADDREERHKNGPASRNAIGRGAVQEGERSCRRSTALTCGCPRTQETPPTRRRSAGVRVAFAVFGGGRRWAQGASSHWAAFSCHSRPAAVMRTRSGSPSLSRSISRIPRSALKAGMG